MLRANCFSNPVMTVSNHRPHTYPEGRIDASFEQTIAGLSSIPDYAINKFLKDAQQKLFNNTLFVVKADHCSKSAGKTDLPA